VGVEGVYGLNCKVPAYQVLDSELNPQYYKKKEREREKERKKKRKTGGKKERGEK
jgi:uncharacterized protein YecT (DUF1311 family)